jgi:glycosyltransferase involved in cell wall biosynthesis
MAVHLMSQMHGNGFDVTALVLGQKDGSPLETILESRGVAAIFLGKDAGFDPRIYSRVHRALLQVRPDIVHTHVHVLRYLLPEIMFRYRGVTIHTVHNLAEWEVEGRAQWIQKIAFKVGVKPISVAHEVARSLERRYGVRESQVIPNCIPVSAFRPSALGRERWRSQEGISQHDVVYTCVALLRPQKNHERLLRAFAAGPAKDPRAKLLLAGAGPLEEGLRQIVADEKLTENVRFLGLRKDVPAILTASDAFVLASDYEGNPLAMMEAMAAGLPVISTSVGGVPELVTHGKDGLLMAPSDERGLRDALNLFLADPVKRRGMGRAARQSAETKFDLPLMIQAYHLLYESLGSNAGKNAALVPSV